MKMIRIIAGPLSVGEGDKVVLSQSQIEPRGHMLRVVEEKEVFSLCLATRGLQFKTGEIVGVEKVPKIFRGQVEELDEAATVVAAEEIAAAEKARVAALAAAKAEAQRKASAGKKPAKA